MDAFHRQSLCGRRERIEGLAQFVHLVTPPLRPLPVRAIHVGVTHGDVERASRPLPQFVIELIITMEGPCKVCVVARLSIFHL